MKVEDLVGRKVWVKSDQFRSVPGIVSGVPRPVNLDDVASSVKESIFRVDLLSGDVVEVSGAEISKIEQAAEVRTVSWTSGLNPAGLIAPS